MKFKFSDLQHRVERWLLELPAAEQDGEREVLRLLNELPDASDFYLYLDRAMPFDPAERWALGRIIANDRLGFSARRDLLDACRIGQPPTELLGWSRDPSLRGVASLYQSALRAVSSEHWPEPPFHNGEWAPHPGADNLPGLADLLGRRFRGHPELVARMARAATKERGMVRKDMAGSSLRPHLVSALKTLQASHPTGVRGHLEALDEEMRRLDIVRALHERKKTPTAPIAGAIYRGDDGKRVVLHLAQLSDGLFGLLFKPKHRYAWTEGSLHDVLATVPERWFDAALRAADPS